MTTGWKLDREQRDVLLERYPACYAHAIADHVTYRDRSGSSKRVAPHPVREARIVGRADDGRGVEVMVVAIDGTTHRPDSGTWHVTWSLAEGREAKESNDVISAGGWIPLDGPSLALAPACW